MDADMRRRHVRRRLYVPPRFQKYLLLCTHLQGVRVDSEGQGQTCLYGDSKCPGWNLHADSAHV